MVVLCSDGRRLPLRATGYGRRTTPSSGFEILPKQPPAYRIKLKLHEQTFELLLIRWPHLETIQFDGARRVAKNGDQPLGEQRHVSIRGERLLYPAGQIRLMGKQILHAVVLPDEFHGRLLSDAWHPGNVVR